METLKSFFLEFMAIVALVLVIVALQIFFEFIFKKRMKK